ncbi:MAG: hypothetical protein JWR61_60 [Ferruginibacter sp.]|uniref:DUF3078 domain-containing protein n=1 Tax=Ferruginibacter sp. TaxID=1940288 RepID=UPI0026588497|nr:DUF3078 domain-containing protein [Ferruginibacter sp.]MDB5275105.1 hypothetical protein [Ferruginibacter sp.]
MKYLFVTAVFLCVLDIAIAQDTSLKEMKVIAENAVKNDTIKKADKNGWIKGLACSISLTQVSNSNWISAGGDRFSLSTAATVNAFASKKWGRKNWDNSLDFNYGLIKTTSLGSRKFNDRIDLVSKYGYAPANWNKVNISILGQLRTQLTSGYEYNYFETANKRRNSGFFAPAYIVIAPGISWTPLSWFSVFGSPLATRWTIVTNGPYSYLSQGGIFNSHMETPLATLYGVNPLKQHRGEFGTFVTAVIRKDIVKNVAYSGKLDLYSNYLRNPQNVDLFWTNQFKVKVNRFIQVSYSLDLLYDDDVKKSSVPSQTIGLQMLSTLGVGFALNL